MGTKQFGPWEACGQYVRTKRNADGSGGWMVAECPVLNGNSNQHAQLFASAPELLEALQRIANGQEMTGNFTHAETVLRYQEIARAAIASMESAQ